MCNLLKIHIPYALLEGTRRFLLKSVQFALHMFNENDVFKPKVKFIKKWFDASFDSEKYDVIIHSHFFEHLFNPIEGLAKMNDCLNEGGTMYFSVPNLEYILDNGFLPGNVLHFEHTFFYKKYDLVNLLNLFGFMFIIVNTLEFFRKTFHSI